MLLRYDPFRDIDRMSEGVGRPTRPILAMDAVRDEHQVTIYIDVPGVATDDIDVSIEKNELTITVERRWDDEDQEILSSERPQGVFSRRIVLSEVLDLEQLSARTSSGVLIITIPVAERSKPRRIDVSTEHHDESIAATTN